MNRNLNFAITGSFVFALAWMGTAVAQTKPEEKAAAVSEEDEKAALEAGRMEAELGKYKDTTPEAAELMVKLVDFYHQQGQVFGLTRIGQRFVAIHTTDPRHQAVMLKLIDGLDAAARNKELVATCRQFIQRYPNSPAVPDLEIRLAATLEELLDYDGAGDAHRAVWKRAGATEAGMHHALKAVTLYTYVNTKEVFTKAADLASELVEKLPDGPLSREMVYVSMFQYQRGNEWAKANRTGAVALQRGLQLTPERRRWLHFTMGENFGRQTQWANAVDSYRKARAEKDGIDVHMALLQSLANDANSTPNDLAPLVQEFQQKYPDRRERFAMESLLAFKHRTAAQRPQAQAAFARLMEYDARTASHAYYYLEQTPNEAADNAAAEQALLAAITKNPEINDKAYLRDVLAFNLYRDRLKDINKAKPILRDFISLSPTNDGRVQAALDLLLTSAASDQEFQQDVALALDSMKKNIHHPNWRSYLVPWAKSYGKDEKVKARADFALAQGEKWENDPLYKLYAASEAWSPESQAARDQLIKTGKVTELSDPAAAALLWRNAYHLRHYAPGERRPEAAPAFGTLAKKFPKEYDYVWEYLISATDYGPKELSKEAALQLLTFEPKSNSHEVFRRLFLAADQNADPELAKQSLAWMQKAEKAFGPSTTYAHFVGDVLLKLNLKAEAIDVWKSHIDIDVNANDSYQCADRLLAQLPEGPEREQFLQARFAIDSDLHGYYASQIADLAFKAGDLKKFEQILTATRDRQKQRPFRNWGLGEYPPRPWVEQTRADVNASPEKKRIVYTAVKDLNIGRPSAMATLSLWTEFPETAAKDPMDRLRQIVGVTRTVDNSTTDWDVLMPYVQAALTRKDYLFAATLAGGMLSDIPNIDPSRQQAGRAIVAQSYSRLGAVGLTIDERSELAPLMQAALYLRLGDRTMALESYSANKALFNAKRDEVPFDLLLFVCESLTAVGGDENHEYVEEVLRGWLVKNSENPQFDASMKASVQLMLAKNFDRARRYDIARSEYATILNRYADTPQAIEAEFGIGEAFMAQKVYDQAEAVFEKLAVSRNVDIVVRAEFLRGVLAYRRGDKDEARTIFKNVLDRVPNIELANQALFNLAEVYKDEERFIDQLNLLRTVGRLGKKSKRTHSPGMPLSIVVQDSDLGISRGHSRIPVIVTTLPGGDQERLFLTSGGAGKGLFRADLETRLGQVTKGDGILQLTGKDTIQCDYPDEFKQEFKSVPLSDVEIRVAADGRLRMSSSKIIDEKEETFSQRLERETRERQQDLRVSQARPYFQIKPGNPIYLRVDDADRDLGDTVDEVVLKLTAESGDTVQVHLKETGSHTGVFEGVATTAELPAGALAKDMALEHPPVMAIDQDPASYWMSEPDGATPKWLSIDMKDLKPVSRVRIASPIKDRNIPVRGELVGSYDGQFWFRLASQPPQPPAPPTLEKFGRMQLRVYPGNYTGLSNWNQILDLSKNAKPIDQKEVDTLAWQLPADAENAAAPYAALWDGKFVQDRAGAARIFVNGNCTGLWIDGRLELPIGAGPRSVDLWLERGIHELTIFSATVNGTQGVASVIARGDANAATVTMYPFRASDFDLDDANLKPARVPEPARGDFARGEWTFAFEPRELRHVKFVVQEYIGEAVAISMFEIAGEDADEIFIPTQDDVLTLSTNQTLEIAGGDVITGAYTDEATHQDRDGSRLLTEKLTATYFNASVQAIQYEFLRDRNGSVQEIAKQVMRISPGDRFIVEITDYDLDQSAEQDTAKFDIIINDGAPVEFVAMETEAYTGKFRKEIDTAAIEEDGKVKIAPGDRVYIRYIDSQNTFPGHAVPREAVVYGNTPSAGRVRILETRVIPGNRQTGVPPQFIYHTPSRDQSTSHVAFEAPLTVEVIDPDAARDSRSEVVVNLTTPAGSQVDVRCVVSGAFEPTSQGLPYGLADSLALEEGRFIGQVIMQLGGKNSPQEVPVTSEMPRNLVGGTVSESGKGGVNDVSLVTRVLNLTGQDKIMAVYNDEQTLKNSPKKLKAQAQLISNGKLRSTDRDYDKDVADLHVGEKLFLIVTDPDQDRTDERDAVTVEISTAFGDKESIQLYETLAHSGIFTGSVGMKSSSEPEPGNYDEEEPAVEVYFGDTVTMTYHDPAASTEQGTLVSTVEAPVVIGTDGLVAAFTKTFNDEKLAVETKFTIAESYFELFKSHKQLGRNSEQKGDLEAGRRVLREVMEDYPDPKYVPRIAYLLGQFSQELGDWDEAVSAYRMIIDQYPDHQLAPDAQYKMAQAYEERGDFDEALEAYVTLAATYPKSPLIASVMIRICDHFYKAEEYRIAAQVGEKFIERFEGHQHASRIAFRIGQCFYKAESFTEAGKAFDRFAKEFPDDTLTPDSVFWSGESYRKGNSISEAFRRYNRCRWDYPASEAAKFARGRLALPEMLQQFESEANSIENP